MPFLIMRVCIKETFVSDYGLMPHQMIEVQDRLVFPPKPQNKMGRKIDW